MDGSLVVKQRLNELGLDQRDLAAAIQVTDSYISQLLTRKKAPPAPGRTDIYDRMGEFLRLPAGELSKLADVQRQEELKKRVAEPGAPTSFCHRTRLRAGLEQFLMDKSLSGDATEEGIEFLEMLKFRERRPAPLYYYRELQNLRDPLHSPATAQPKEQPRASG